MGINKLRQEIANQLNIGRATKFDRYLPYINLIDEEIISTFINKNNSDWDSIEVGVEDSVDSKDYIVATTIIYFPVFNSEEKNKLQIQFVRDVNPNHEDGEEFIVEYTELSESKYTKEYLSFDEIDKFIEQYKKQQGIDIKKEKLQNLINKKKHLMSEMLELDKQLVELGDTNS